MIDPVALGVFLVVGLALAGVGARLLLGTRAFMRRAQRSSGVVTRLHQTIRRGSGRSRGRRISYFPVVRFTTMEGGEVEAMSPIGGSPAPQQPGDVVDVLYDPADPSAIRIDSLSGRGFLLSGLVTGFGLALACGVTLAYVLR